MERLNLMKLFLKVSLFFLLISSANADFSFDGHAKAQITSVNFQNDTPQSKVGARRFAEHELDIRGNSKYNYKTFSLVAQGEVLAVGGKWG